MAEYALKMFDGDKKAIYSYTALIASTTAETYNVDASGLNARQSDGASCTYLNINKVWWSINHSAVTKPLTLEWVNSSTNPIGLALTGNGFHDFSSIGGLQNTKAANYTGDVLINFASVTNSDTCSVVIEFLKQYDSIS
jgi:hypothetical protein